MAIGFDTAVMGSLTVGMFIIIVAIFLIVGAILWASRVTKVRNLGLGMTVFSLVLLSVLAIAMVVRPAEVTVPSEDQPGVFDVLSVANVTGATFIQSSKTFTVAMTTNTTAGTITPTALLATFSVQRVDAGDTTNIKTVTAAVSQNTLTDPVTGDTYNAILPTSYGDPDVDWTLTPGTVTATNTLTAQVGLTPYQVGTFAVNIHWNAAAFVTDNISVNDVIYVGSVTIGGEVYTIQVLIDAINT